MLIEGYAIAGFPTLQSPCTFVNTVKVVFGRE